MVALPRRTYVVVYFAYRNAEGFHLDPFGNKFMICTSAEKGRGKYSALAEWMVIPSGCVASRINYPSNVTPSEWLQLLPVATDASKPRLLPFSFGSGVVLWLVTGDE